MILNLKPNVDRASIDKLISRLAWMGLHAVVVGEKEHMHIAIINGEDKNVHADQFVAFPEVESVGNFKGKLRLADKTYKDERTIIRIKNQTIGGGKLAVMAGPCSIENEEQVELTAKLVAAAGANILRGGAFKPRTSPYDFQGLGEPGLLYLEKAAKKYGLLSITEVMDIKQINLVAEHIDILQIGARNMQNFNLLKEIGKAGKPILLKRGLSATYMELLLAAEYILEAGNPNVMLCERGIRTFETYARNTLDIAAVPILHELTHLPVIIDPSHGTGIRSMVKPMACAAVAAGADGLIIEVHPEPDKAWSDSVQTISPAMFADMMKALKQIGAAVNIQIPEPTA
jgi:3-deoxy-7-phosphoheptulonate synthase